MFRDVPECSGMFHVPAFIDALRVTGVVNTKSISATFSAYF